MANRAPGVPRAGSTQGLGDALRRAVARGAGTAELEDMIRARHRAFLAVELRRGLAGVAGLAASAWQSLAAAPRQGPAYRSGLWSAKRRHGERDGV